MSFTNKLVSISWDAKLTDVSTLLSQAAFAQDKRCLSAHQYGYVITALEVPGPNTEFP
jgi:hypothetical protein